MTVSVTTTDVHGVTVVAISGAVSTELMSCLADGIAAVADDARAVVIDLDDHALADDRAVRALLHSLRRRGGTWAMSRNRISSNLARPEPAAVAV